MSSANGSALAAYTPKHAYFVGIDSDGCAFDAMEIKHKECFTPNTIRHWNLQPIAKYARETAEFVNLYSKWRGGNRWPSLLKVLEFLSERAEVLARGVQVPRAARLQEFIDSGFQLSDSGLQEYATRYPHPELDQGLAWSRGVSQSIAEMVQGVPPFPFVRESLQRMQGRVDLMVVSATPLDALLREWEEHDLTRYMDVVAGQEMGAKAEHLKLAAKGKYPDDHILLIGDAPSDRAAAHSVNVLYYPINPGHEEQSWQRFHDEALGRFLNGTYAGAYESSLIAEFDRLLPDSPPWKDRN